MLQRRDDRESERPAPGRGGLRGLWKQVSTSLRARARLRRQQAARARTQRLKYVAPEQLAYADILDFGTAAGRYFLALTFALYVFGITTPVVPLADLPVYWSMSAQDYSIMAGVGSGWSWFTMAARGDYMNFLGIAFLSGLSIACCLRVLAFSFERRDVTFTSILVAEVLVLSLAASGLLAFGH